MLATGALGELIANSQAHPKVISTMSANSATGLAPPSDQKIVRENEDDNDVDNQMKIKTSSESGCVIASVISNADIDIDSTSSATGSLPPSIQKIDLENDVDNQLRS